MAHSKCLSMLCCLLMVAAVHGATRSLKQDALSNSNGCLPTIPKCEAGACATRNVMGLARWVCLRCLANYEPVVDTSGQDNIIQCVCPKGYFEASATSGNCTRCPANTYCPGGDKVENPTSRGTNFTCGSNLVTRNTGARSQADCVAPAGYAMTSPTTATPCDRSSYAPMYNRLGKCLRCQSGLEEPLNSGLADGGRISKSVVCKVPPGRYVSQGLVRVCPQGFYRENYTDFTAAVSQKCLPCNPGITTAGAGAKLVSECNVVLPGYGINNVYNNATGQSSVPALPSSNDTGLPTASICDIGFYSTGGYCAQCPGNSTTRVKGAKAVEECVVPPGYYLPSATMVQCDTGFFREGWLMASDPKATSCTACGDNILSEPRDLDEHPLAANGSLVRGSSASCFIDAGQGMIATGKNLFAAKDCPINTYGAAGKVYGWAAAPCKPCPRNMITDSLTKVNNSDTCINPDGFGYASEGASRCSPGFYALKGSRKPCQQCAAGRTTADDVTKQRLVTDCFVAAGYGVVNSTANSTDAFNPNTTDLTDAQLAAMPVLECPFGYYSAGGNGAKCVACPFGSTTEGLGSTSVDNCTVCIAGYGKADSSSPCTPCPYGTYQPGGLASCITCPRSDFYTPVDGLGDVVNSLGTTLYTASTSEEACVPKQSQLSPEAGQAYFTPGTVVQLTAAPAAAAASPAACVASCPTDSCCLSQFTVTNATSGAASCSYATLSPGAASAAGPQLAYKLPPSTLGSASSVSKTKVRGKMISSGYYALCDIPSATVDDWFTVGSNLTADARTFSKATTAEWDTVSSKGDCKKKCDDSNVCLGFIVNTLSGGVVKCSYRGGVDALLSRSFFALPVASASLDISSLGW